MSRTGLRITKAALIAVAVLATFGIGLFVGRELSRPASPAPDASAQYSLDSLAKVPPDLLRYRLLRSFTVNLQEPRGIACGAADTVYVCGDRAVLALTPEGREKRRYPLDGEPRCVAVSPDGRIFVGMETHVEVLDPASGNAEHWPDLGSQAIVTSIGAGSGAVFIADAGNREVLRFDRGGKLLGRVGKGYTVPSPFFDVVASPDGTLWAADPGGLSVRHYAAGGDLLGSWGKSSMEVDGFGGCCNPAHIAQLPCGRIVTSEKGLLRVKVFEPDGKLFAVAALPHDFPATEKSLDIATRKANGGEILVLVPAARAVRVYAGKGNAGQGQTGREPAGKGQTGTCDAGKESASKGGAGGG
jgi:hypothetical protein